MKMTPEYQLFISEIEDTYRAKYVGRYEREGSLLFLDVFYQTDPDLEAGHTHYFGIYRHPLNGTLMITNAENEMKIAYPAIHLGGGEYLVSRGQHDYVSKGEIYLDGGPAYQRYNPAYPPTHWMTIEEGAEVFDYGYGDK